MVVKENLRRVATWVATCLLVGLSLPRCLAQDSSTESRPAVVVSVASVDRLMGDIGYLSRAAGWPQVGALATMLATPYLQDVDTKSPAGVFVSLGGGKPSGVAFIGTKNFQGLLAKIEEQVGKAQDLGGGLLKFSLQSDVFLKQQGNWLFASDSATHLASVPNDPSQFLQSLSSTYTLAVRVNAGSIPPEMKAVAVEKLKVDAQQRLEREMQDKSPEERQQAEATAQQGIEVLTSLIEDTDQLTIGLGTDSQAGKTYLDTTLTARPGTRLADHVAKTGSMPALISGFDLPGAAIVLKYNIVVPQQVAANAARLVVQLRGQAMKRIDNNRKIPDETVRAAVKETANALIDVVAATLQRGHLQGGAAVSLTPGDVKVAAGAVVADGGKMEPALRGLVESLQNQADFPAVSFDAQTHRNVDLHTLTVPVAEKDAGARQAFGPQLNIAIGTSNDTAYVAFGRDAAGQLTQVLGAANPNSPVSPLKLSVAVAPMLTLAAAMEQDPAVTALAKSMSNANGKDHVSLNATPVERGIRYRLEVEEAVLGLLREVAKLRSAELGEQ